MTDLLEINGLVLRIDYFIRTLVNLGNHPRTDEIILLLGEVCNELISAAQSMLVASDWNLLPKFTLTVEGDTPLK